MQAFVYQNYPSCLLLPLPRSPVALKPAATVLDESCKMPTKVLKYVNNVI